MMAGTTTTEPATMSAREQRVSNVKKVAGEIQKGSNSAGARLRSIVDRIEKLEEEKAAVGADIKDVYAEAKGAGFDPAVLRMLIRNRKEDADTMAERQELLDLYTHAIGD
jgi:uncharacterized protein (UPF0335 family)